MTTIISNCSLTLCLWMKLDDGVGGMGEWKQREFSCLCSLAGARWFALTCHYPHRRRRALCRCSQGRDLPMIVVRPPRAIIITRAAAAAEVLQGREGWTVDAVPVDRCPVVDPRGRSTAPRRPTAAKSSFVADICRRVVRLRVWNNESLRRRDDDRTFTARISTQLTSKYNTVLVSYRTATGWSVIS